MPQFKAWSYSALAQFENCPRQYYEIKVAKRVVEQPSAEMLRGNEVHKQIENHIKEGQPLPRELAHVEAMVNVLRGKPGELFAEREMCLNEDLKPVKWFAKDAWLRGKIDAGVRFTKSMWIGDWKTGKRKLDSDQLMLFGAQALELDKTLDFVDAAFIWLPDRKIDTTRYHRDQLADIWGHFLPKVNKLRSAFEEDKWPERPSGLCRGWCPVKDCPNWEPKK